MPLQPVHRRPRVAPALSRLTLAAALLCGLGPAHAGRPLGTDDASAAAAGTCQAEAWAERSRGAADGAWVLAPAGGLRDGLELGGDLTRFQAGQGLRGAASLGLKWVPDAATVQTAVGELALGLKLGLAYEQPASQGWRHSAAGLLALATLTPAEGLALHANLGSQRSAAFGRVTTHLRLALSWTPHPAALLFAESQVNDRPALDGSTVNTLGGRWWLLPERLGLDLTASREAGSGYPTRWSVGIGWYGIGP